MLILSKTLRPNKKNKLQDGREQKKIYTRKQVEGLGIRQRNSTRQAIVLQPSTHFIHYIKKPQNKTKNLC